MNYPVSKDLKDLNSIFNRNGYKLYIVGGAIRDFILGKTNDDVDFATSATPQEMLAMFPFAIKTGLRHGTLTIPFRKKYYEITTFREDEGYSDCRHPDKITFIRSIETDLARRDFTINAMAADAGTGKIMDNYNGIADLGEKIVKAVGNPEKRFAEDALRMLRAIRFASKLDFRIENRTLKAIRDLCANIKKVSVERIMVEMEKMINSDHAVGGLVQLHATGLLENIMPDIESDMKHASRKTHIMNALGRECAARSQIEIKFATLLYYRDNAQEILQSLKCSNKFIRNVCNLVEFKKIHRYTTSGIKLALAEIGRENSDILINFIKFNTRESKSTRHLEKIIKRTIGNNEPIEIKDLAINGNDLVQMGFSGREIGAKLDLALKEVLRRPKSNSADKLKSLCRSNLINQRAD